MPPGCGDWQPIVTVRASCLCLLSPVSTATSCLMLVRGCHQDGGPGFHYQSPGLVQLTVLRHHWQVDATSAVGAEYCGQADHWHTTMWPHLTGASPTILASSASARQLQDRHTCSSMSVRPRPKLPGWQLPTRYWRRRQTIAFCWHPNTGRRSHTKLFWQQNICCGSTSALEQFAVWQDTLTCPKVSWGGHLRRFFLGATAQCDSC